MKRVSKVPVNIKKGPFAPLPETASLAPSSSARLVEDTTEAEEGAE